MSILYFILKGESGNTSYEVHMNSINIPTEGYEDFYGLNL